MAYVLPESVLVWLIEIICTVILPVLLISFFFIDKCSCYFVNKCFHSILTKTKILERLPDKTTVFYDFPVEEESYFMNYYFIWYITWLIYGAAIVFLDVFLIDITNSCDPSASRAECFLNTGLFNISALYDEPIDCNNLDDLPHNVTFICYRYTLDLGGAFGTAGGFFATGMMFITLIAVCYGKEKPSDCCDEDCCCNNSCCCMIVGIIHMLVGTVFSLTAFILAVTVPTLRQILTEGSFIVFFQFYHILISLIFVHSILIPWMMVYRRLQEKSQDTELKESSYN